MRAGVLLPMRTGPNALPNDRHPLGVPSIAYHLTHPLSRPPVTGFKVTADATHGSKVPT